jgi:hypothetical protein
MNFKQIRAIVFHKIESPKQNQASVMIYPDLDQLLL